MKRKLQSSARKRLLQRNKHKQTYRRHALFIQEMDKHQEA